MVAVGNVSLKDMVLDVVFRGNPKVTQEKGNGLCLFCSPKSRDEQLYNVSWSENQDLSVGERVSSATNRTSIHYSCLREYGEKNQKGMLFLSEAMRDIFP